MRAGVTRICGTSPAQSFVDAPRAPAELRIRRPRAVLLGCEQRAATVLMVNGYPVLPSADWLFYQWDRNQ